MASTGYREWPKRFGCRRLLPAMKPTTPRALMARFRNRPLRFPPGFRFEYNSSYVLLGLIIERASGESYQTFLQHAVLDVSR